MPLRPRPRRFRPHKGVLVTCPGDLLAVGGGGSINDGGRKGVRLTTWMPLGVRLITHHVGRYLAVAEPPNLSRFPWSLRVTVICASDFALRDDGIRNALVYNGASATFDHVKATCPSGKVAWAAGAEVWAPDGDGGSIPT